MPKSLLIVLALALLGVPKVFAITAEAGLTTDRVGVGETFQLKVSVSSEEKISDLPWPVVEGLHPFKVAKTSGTSSSSHTSIINGKISQRQTFITEFAYNLTATKVGTFTIGPIRYKYKEFDKVLGQAQVTVEKTEAGLDLAPSLSKSSVYVGEQVLYNLRIIPKNTVQNIRPPDFSKAIGKSFYMTQLETEIKPKTVTLGGESKRVFDIRFAMYPLLKDEGTFPSYSITYEEVVMNRSRRRSVFDDFFGGGGKVIEKTASTDPLSIRVKALPPGAPKNFSGAVGQIQLEANVNTHSLATGEALTLTVTLSGNAQPKSLTRPQFPDAPQFDIFDPEITRNTKILGGTIIATNTYKYLLVPSQKGDHTLGPISFDYFDPTSGTYKTAASETFTITVTQGADLKAGSSRILNQKNIEELGSDIRHIKKWEGPLTQSSQALYKYPWYWALYLLAPALYLSFYISKKRSAQLESDTGLRRKVQAKSFAKKRLEQSRKARQGEDAREFYKALLQALERFISDKLNLELRGLTVEEARLKLQQKGLSEPQQKEYIRILEACEMGQFGGAKKDSAAWDQLYNETETLINEINKTL